MKFNDGDFPNQNIISEFMQIVYNLNKWDEMEDKKMSSDKNACIAVHCIAGLGR